MTLEFSLPGVASADDAVGQTLRRRGASKPQTRGIGSHLAGLAAGGLLGLTGHRGGVGGNANSKGEKFASAEHSRSGYHDRQERFTLKLARMGERTDSLTLSAR